MDPYVYKLRRYHLPAEIGFDVTKGEDANWRVTDVRRGKIADSCGIETGWIVLVANGRPMIDRRQLEEPGGKETIELTFSIERKHKLSTNVPRLDFTRYSPLAYHFVFNEIGQVVFIACRDPSAVPSLTLHHADAVVLLDGRNISPTEFHGVLKDFDDQIVDVTVERAINATSSTLCLPVEPPMNPTYGVPSTPNDVERVCPTGLASRIIKGPTRIKSESQSGTTGHAKLVKQVEKVKLVRKAPLETRDRQQQSMQMSNISTDPIRLDPKGKVQSGRVSKGQSKAKSESDVGRDSGSSGDDRKQEKTKATGAKQLDKKEDGVKSPIQQLEKKK